MGAARFTGPAQQGQLCSCGSGYARRRSELLPHRSTRASPCRRHRHSHNQDVTVTLATARAPSTGLPTPRRPCARPSSMPRADTRTTGGRESCRVGSRCHHRNGRADAPLSAGSSTSAPSRSGSTRPNCASVTACAARSTTVSRQHLRSRRALQVLLRQGLASVRARRHRRDER